MRKKRNYWNDKTCKKAALKYKSRSEFKKNDGGAYNVAKKLKILDKICSHMISIGNRFKRLVYTFTFNDNAVYVGLTKNIGERKEKHMRDIDSAVYKHIYKTGIQPTLTFTDYLDVKNAILLEEETIKHYENKGFIILNIAKPGAVGGGNLIWNLDKCKAEALKYNSRTEFAKKSNSAYNSARRYGWLKNVCSHMRIIRKAKKINYWTQERCGNVSKKCNSRNEFYKKYPGAYMACLRNDWLGSVCSHMKNKIKKPNNYWTFDMCQIESLKYDTLYQFRTMSGSAYNKSAQKGWLKLICKHMKIKK